MIHWTWLKGKSGVRGITRILLIGENFWCRQIERHLGKLPNIRASVFKKIPANPLKKIKWSIYFHKEMMGTDILHIVSPYSAIKTLKAARKYKIPVICHWIGSDVLKLNDPDKRKLFLSICPPVAVHLAVSDHLADELNRNGIKVFDVVANMTDISSFQPEPLPDKPAVLLYWHDKRSCFFSAPAMYELAGSFPRLLFYVLGATGEGENAPSNVKFIGLQEDVREYLRMCTVYIRWTPHDGQQYPVMVAESLAMGRYVIFNHKALYCEYADSYEKLKDLLSDVVSRRRPNYDGAKFVHENLTPAKIVEKLMFVYQKNSGFPGERL